ncbi:MAG TPA: 2-dehydropantoate 2-reductase [Anaeromyxobacter sp.]
MRIAIAGAGGVGGLLAGLLARAGNEVFVLARGAHAEAIRRDGLRVASPRETFTARVAAVSDDPAALGPAEAVLVAVKAWQVAELAPRLAPLLAKGGIAVPLQNGVEAAARLAAGLGEPRVAGGLVSVLAWIDGPGAVRHMGGVPRLKIGPRAPGQAPALEALAGALRGAGSEVEIVADVERASWEKFLLIEPWGAVAAAARAPAGVVRSVPETRALLVRAQEELAAVARARGVALPADAVARALAIIDSVPPEGTSSMQRDIGAGRASELDDQVGAVVRLARAVGVPVPIHETLHAALLPQEHAARGIVPAFGRT